MRFWDSSAIVPLVLDEVRTLDARTLYRADPEMIVWWATRVECAGAVIRSLRESSGDPMNGQVVRRAIGDVFAHAYEVAPVEDVRERAERLLAVHPLRSADALQLGAALVWARERTTGLGFVSFDERLRRAAGQEGFTVLPA